MCAISALTVVDFCMQTLHHHNICMCICFLLSQGHASSFFGPTMGRYSSFQVHLTDDIRHIQSMDTGVLFLTKSNLKCLTRGGLIMFDYPLVSPFIPQQFVHCLHNSFTHMCMKYSNHKPNHTEKCVLRIRLPSAHGSGS